MGWSAPSYWTSDVQALTNGAKLPVVWSINCQTGWFDNETDNPAGDPTSSGDLYFSEAWERNPNGGAVGVIAATRVSYSGYNDRLIWGWMDAIWPDFETTTPATDPLWEMGTVLNYGKYYMATKYGDSVYRLIQFEMLQWFGDPTMEMWTGVPQPLTVTHDPTLVIGATSFTVDVGQAGALIAITKDGQILGRATSTGPTTVSWSTPLAVGDEIHITITKHDYRPYEGTATAVIQQYYLPLIF